MLKVVLISAIISAILAILAEIFCPEIKAKIFWLGTSALYFFLSLLCFRLLWRGSLIGNIPKQVLVFLLVGASSFVIALLVASLFMALMDQLDIKEREEEGQTDGDEAEASEEAAGEGEAEDAAS